MRPRLRCLSTLRQDGGEYYERYGEYSALYMGEALGDQAAVDWALAHHETPMSGYGRATCDSGRA